MSHVALTVTYDMNMRYMIKFKFSIRDASYFAVARILAFMKYNFPHSLCTAFQIVSEAFSPDSYEHIQRPFPSDKLTSVKF